MTYQQKKSLEISDIKAFCFICKECGVSLSIPTTASLKSGRLEACPTCDEPWLNSSTGNIKALMAFKDALATLAFAVGDGSKSRFTFSLEIASDPSLTGKD
jgi:Zn-finger nucleic acid-binding protein